MPKRASPLIALVLSTVVLVVFAPLLLGGQTWDDPRYHTEVAPPRLAASEAVLGGALPTWWEGTALGVPLLGDPGHGAAYPIAWLAWTPRLLDLIWIAHVLWCALGVALWARRMRASELGALTAGVLVATMGLLTSAALRGALPALAHLPWVGWAASVTAHAHTPHTRARGLALVGVFIALIGLAGQLAVLVQAVVLAIVGGTTGPSRRAIPWLSGAVLAGIAITSVQWLPALHAISDSAGATVHALPLSRLVELVIPASFGAGDPERAVAQIAGEAPWFPSLYVGAPLLALAAIGAPRRRFSVFAGVLAVLALVAARGGWPAWLGAPELHVAALALIAAPHAAAGVDALLAGERRALLAMGGAATVIAIALGGLGALRSSVEGVAVDHAIDRALVTGGLALVCAALSLVLGWRAGALQRQAANGAPRETPDPSRDGKDLTHRASRVDLRSLIVVALLVAPSVGAVPAAAPTTARAIVDEPPAWVVAPERTSAAPLRVYRPVALFEGRTPARREPETLESAFATMSGASAARWGIGAARSEDPARPANHDRVWLAASSAGGELLERYSIELAILPVSMVAGSGVKQLGSRREWALVRYPVAPAAALVYEWVFAGNDETALTRLFPPGVGRGLGPGLVVLHGEGAQNQDEPSAPEPCTIERWSGGAIDLTCEARGSAYAVISSTAADGWRAWVDGAETPWLRADVMRRAVAIPAGAHRVVWRYDAPGLVLALVLAGLGLLGLGAVWLVTRRP